MCTGHRAGSPPHPEEREIGSRKRGSPAAPREEVAPVPHPGCGLSRTHLAPSRRCWGRTRPNFLRCFLGGCFPPAQTNQTKPELGGGGGAQSCVPGGALGAPEAGMAGQAAGEWETSDSAEHASDGTCPPSFPALAQYLCEDANSSGRIPSLMVFGLPRRCHALPCHYPARQV